MNFGDSRIDSSDITGLERSISPAFKHAESESVKRGGATTRKLMIAFIKSEGEGTWDPTAPLTKKTRGRNPKERPALSDLGNLIAFKKTATRGDPVAVVGHTPFISKKGGRVRGMSQKSIRHAYRGHKRTVTREEQQQFAIRAYRIAKGRTRFARTGKSGRPTKATKWRRLTPVEQLRAKRLLRFMPQLGRTITTPEREMPDAILRIHGDDIARKMTKTFDKHFQKGIG